MDSDNKSFVRGRWQALFLVQALTFVYHFSNTNLQPIQSPILNEFGLTLEEFNLLYSITDIPSLIIPFFAPALINRIHTSGLLLLATLTINFGQLLTALAAQLHSYNLMLVARVCMGIFQETQLVAAQLALHKWFSLNEYAFAISFQPLMNGGSKIINSYFMPHVYEVCQSITATLYWSFLLGTFSAICAIAYYFYEKRKIPILRSLSEDTESSENIWGQIKEFKFVLWVTYALHLLFSAAYYSFNTVIFHYIMVKYGYTGIESGNLVILHYVATVLAAPVVGKISSMLNWRGYFFLAAALDFVGCFVYIMFFPSENNLINAVVLLVLLGVFWALVSAPIYPIFSELSTKDGQNTVYAFASVVQSVGIVIFPLLAGKYNDSIEGNNIQYRAYDDFLFIIGLTQLGICLIWAMLFRKYKGEKERPTSFEELPLLHADSLKKQPITAIESRHSLPEQL